MGYCTPKEVLARMGRDATVTASANQQVTDAIEAATAGIVEDCHRTFDAPADDPETRVLPVIGRGTRLYIPDLISAVSIALDYDDDGTYETVLTSADYELDNWHAETYVNEAGERAVWPFEFVSLLRRGVPTGARRRLVQIEGTWGWPTVPAAINQACSILATRLMQRMSAAPFGVQSFGELGAQSIRSSDPDYMTLIGPYRKTGIA